jgi:hypothetical protein
MRAANEDRPQQPLESTADSSQQQQQQQQQGLTPPARKERDLVIPIAVSSALLFAQLLELALHVPQYRTTVHQ